ncbi:unnamed protein product, partial [Strongylus vulgaris]
MGQLRERISDEAKIDPTCMKIIHRGKTIQGNDDLSLLDLKFKENDKLLIMGKVSTTMKDDAGFSALTIQGNDDLSLLDLKFKENDKLLIMGKVSTTMKDDAGFSALVSYENSNLVPLQKLHEDIERDLSAMELNYLDGAPIANSNVHAYFYVCLHCIVDFVLKIFDNNNKCFLVEKSLEMVKKMEKRLAQFTETSMKHLEGLDSLSIIGELTTENQATRNREKRKSLVDGIHTLMNGNDKHVRRLE